MPNVKRDKNNRRVFDAHDIAWIKDPVCLKKCGMSIQEMKVYLALCLQGPGTIPRRKVMLAEKQRARDCTDIRLCFQLLIYPVTDSRMQTESIRRGKDTPCWNASLNRRMWRLYLREGDGGRPAWAAPMLAERFDGLPPAYLEVEQFDCLHDEGLAYAGALRGAGVPVQVEEVAGTFHGFDVFCKAGIVQTMIKTRSRALRAAFGG